MKSSYIFDFLKSHSQLNAAEPQNLRRDLAEFQQHTVTGMITSFAARQHDVMMLDIADFQIDQHKATQDAMIKDQIDSIALPPQNTAG